MCIRDRYLYRSKNAAEKFMIFLVETFNLMGSLNKQNIPLHMTRDDKMKFWILFMQCALLSLIHI